MGHCRHVSAGGFEVTRPEEDARHDDEVEGGEYGDPGCPSRHRAGAGVRRTRAAPPALEADHAAVRCSIGDEVPARTVPQPDGKKGQHQVAIDIAATRAAQPEKQVVAEEARYRNVPALPEVRDRLREVGPIEIDR